MLVVCANWGIGDGSLRPAPPPARIGDFIEGLRRSAVLAGWQEQGRYEPLAGIDVVLAGDTCDFYASRHWLEGGRPWGRDAASRRTRERVVNGALGEAGRVLEPLAAIARRGLALPGADRRGRPAFDAPVTVPVRVILLEGNLDGGVGGTLWPLATAALRLPVGVALESDGLVVEHGHAADAAWCGDGDGPPLGASLRIDLCTRYLESSAVTPLPWPWRRDLAERLLACDLVDVGALRRGAAVPQAGPALLGRLDEAWRRSVEAWRQAAWNDGVGRSVPFDLLDAVAARLVGPALPDDGAGDELARLLRPAVAARAGTVVLGHPPVERSQPRATPRVVCLGRAGAAAEGAVPGVHEIQPGAAHRVLPPGAVVPLAGRWGVRACPPGAVPAPWTDIPAPVAVRRRVVEAA